MNNCVNCIHINGCTNRIETCRQFKLRELTKFEKGLIRHGLIVGAILGFFMGLFFGVPI